MSDDPGQPKVPKHLRDLKPDHAYDSVQGFLKWAKENVEATLTTEQRIREEHKTYLLYAFLSEIDITPSQCVLVEKRDGNNTWWGFARKHPQDIHTKALLAEKDAQLTRLHRQLVELREEVTYLKAQR